MLFHILGPLDVHHPATPATRVSGGKPGRLLAALLLAANSWVARDRLVAAVWSGCPVPASAQANLKTYVWQLRTGLPAHPGGARIERRPGAYRLRVADGELDAELAEELAGGARRAADGGDAGTAAALCEQALRLWRGRPFEDLAGDWADHVGAAEAIGRLEQLHLDLRELLAEQQLALGRPRPALAALRPVTATAPLRESAWALTVRALHAAGQPGAALATRRKAREIIRTELGVGRGPCRPVRPATDTGPPSAGTSVDIGHPYAAGGLSYGGGPRSSARRSAARELPRDVALVGRGTPLRAVWRAAAGAAPVVLVDGMAGVGKTALVVHAAHRLAPRYPDGQFFVALRAGRHGDGPEPATVLERLLRGLGVPAAEIPADQAGRSALWRSALAGRRALLVLDDVRDGGQLAALLPAAPGCLTLATTRYRGWHPDAAVRIGLTPLAEPAAADLFRAAAVDRVTDADGAAVAAVVRHCGGLPAALRDAAGRLLSRPGWPVARLVEELTDDPCRVLSDRLRRSVGAAVAALDSCGLAAWRAVAGLPEEFGPAAAARVLGLRPAAARTLLEALVDQGLLEVGPVGRYRSHVLIRELAGRFEEPAANAASAHPTVRQGAA
ncbi:AfsR/SARP family transcriptional regulator [Solwaraspora sp. WMMD1047]|uniref:AfsR/SARP family transcriptional regulator n=1 Tax=Solwaraspora sp. WMMD1047 TaxID=3016102 RepID=UPI002416A52D|nr:AfsR/SARP family transcriptional regulator [Solwaraspora sp. WMMD1047]MDG4831862.1 AfsR/SARP family transcriptional regulator [Solwaraspora sp. WMMD1047]